MHTKPRAALLIALAIFSLGAANGPAISASPGEHIDLKKIIDRAEMPTNRHLQQHAPPHAAAPANDNCAGAYEITPGSNYWYYNYSANDGPSVPGMGAMQKDVWFFCDCAVEGPMVVFSLTADFDTRIAVYAANPDCSNLMLLGYNDDYCSPQSAVMVYDPYFQPYTEFYIQVAGVKGATGQFAIYSESGFYDCWAECNDDCSELTSGTCHGYESGIPVLAGHNTIEFTRTGYSACSHDNDCEQIGPAVWEAFEVTEDMAVDLRFCGSYHTFDTLFTFLVMDCPCGAGDPHSSEDFVTCSHVDWNSCGDGNAVLTWDSLPPGVYYYPIPWDECRDVWQYTLSMTGRTKCCVFERGDLDDDPFFLSLGDLVKMIDFLYISLTPPACWEEANIDGSQPEGPGSVTLGDLTALIAYLFIVLHPPPPCPY